jgi:hypothetical protein
MIRDRTTMRTTTMKAAVGLLLAGVPIAAIAGPAAGRLPEPETLALVGIGAVALLIAKYRKRK